MTESTNSLNEGRLLKKKRCVLHLQSDEPNPAMGTQPPRSLLMTRAQRCSRQTRS
jgi:hypothetical protein